MSDKGKQVETVLDQFGMKHLQQSHFSNSDAGKRAFQRSSIYQPKIAESLPDCCEFATGIISEGTENRNCIRGCFCEATFFKDPTKYPTCFLRKQIIADKET